MVPRPHCRIIGWLKSCAIRPKFQTHPLGAHANSMVQRQRGQPPQRAGDTRLPNAELGGTQFADRSIGLKSRRSRATVLVSFGSGASGWFSFSSCR